MADRPRVDNPRYSLWSGKPLGMWRGIHSARPAESGTNRLTLLRRLFFARRIGAAAKCGGDEWLKSLFDVRHLLHAQGRLGAGHPRAKRGVV